MHNPGASIFVWSNSLSHSGLVKRKHDFTFAPPFFIAEYSANIWAPSQSKAHAKDERLFPPLGVVFGEGGRQPSSFGHTVFFLLKNLTSWSEWMVPWVSGAQGLNARFFSVNRLKKSSRRIIRVRRLRLEQSHINLETYIAAAIAICWHTTQGQGRNVLGWLVLPQATPGGGGKCPWLEQLE